ncbi:unnamed protein product [Discula destructiva]
MAGSNLVTALRGFKIRTSTLDKFLVAHGKPHGTNSGTIPPIYKYDDNGNATDEISEVLRAQIEAVAGKSSSLATVLLVMPSSRAYVAYSYAQIYAQRHINPQGHSEQMPQGFEELRQDVLKYNTNSEDNDEGLMGLVVITECRAGPTPTELLERDQAPVQCGICEQTFDMWSARQLHRNDVHGKKEELDALPANA